MLWILILKKKCYIKASKPINKHERPENFSEFQQYIYYNIFMYQRHKAQHPYTLVYTEIILYQVGIYKRKKKKQTNKHC